MIKRILTTLSKIPSVGPQMVISLFGKYFSILLVTVIFVTTSDSHARTEKVPLSAKATVITDYDPNDYSTSPRVTKFCFEGTVWVTFNSRAGGQQLDKNGKPVPCSTPEEVKKAQGR